MVWEEVQVVSPDGAEGVFPHPWIETTPEGELVFAWYAEIDGDRSVLAAWGSLDEMQTQVVALENVSGLPGDHSHVSIAPEVA